MASANTTTAIKTHSASSSGSRTWKSRAVLRAVQPGSWVTCHSCSEQIKYQVRAQNMQMICNVYEDGVWNRVEHFHSGCYDSSGQPHGPAED